ncbi:MAG: phosphate/phosphite/phosphonate ABC transporter substrate-binding protein [Cyanobacteriota bacterium]|nr:phosphate/phosphite/phosphonate ABC transporter substrate-binding protein [Cyanobacteriota bacterium]
MKLTQNLTRWGLNILGFSLLLVGCQTKPDNLQPPVSSTPTPINAQSPTFSGEPVQFAVLSIDSAVSVNERYKPLLNYLAEQTNRPFELVPVTQASQFTDVEAGKIDFTTNNPLAAVQIQRLYDTQFLVTHSRPKTGTQFSGLIVVKQESEIQTIEDLKGKKVACVNFQTAAAGCVFQIDYLLENGIDPFEAFGSFIENKSQDNIVLAVLNGTIDAGFIRTGQLEKMFNQGLLKSLDEVRVLNSVNDDFYYRHTTALYPEWPIASTSNADPALVKKVQEALLNIPPEHPALEAVKVEKFVPAVNYEQLDRLIENLQLKSWDSP